jgi:hypothetical protein
MNPLFIGDPNHERKDLIEEFRSALRGYYMAGYRTLFLEFLPETPAEDKKELAEQFEFFSNGRRGVLENYVGMVLEARSAGFAVYGLELPIYIGEMKQIANKWAGVAFRFMGGFDAIAAELVRQRASKHNTYNGDQLIWIGPSVSMLFCSRVSMTTLPESRSTPR